MTFDPVPRPRRDRETWGACLLAVRAYGGDSGCAAVSPPALRRPTGDRREGAAPMKRPRRELNYGGR
jgi:hypothetical protein